jgi:hypothetical protein
MTTHTLIKTIDAAKYGTRESPNNYGISMIL